MEICYNKLLKNRVFIGGKENQDGAKRHNKRTRLDDMGGVCCICPDNNPFTDHFDMAIGKKTLPAAMAYVFGVTTLLDCAVMMILANSICKK
jgi:hypothetical protein